MSRYADLVALRHEAEAATAAARAAADELETLRHELQRLRDEEPGNRRQILVLQRRIGALAPRADEARGTADVAEAAYRAALAGLTADLDPAVPCLLLPMRLETRLRARTDGVAGREVIVRIFPDEVHRDEHDPALTAAELQLGRHYWTQRWAVEAAGGSDAERERLAVWQQLAARVGSARAAWVARALTPENLPPEAGSAPVFPTPAERAPGTGHGSLAAALPDCWLVRLRRDGRLLGQARGELIPRPLALGPPPDPDDALSPARWLVDLEAAVDVGMAVVVRPDPEDDLDRVDLVTVTGVRGADDARESAVLLRDLLDAHQFAPGITGPGLDVLPQGTATNNTEGARSPLRRDGAGARSATAQLGPAGAARGDGSDAARLAAALGVPDRDPVSAADADVFLYSRLEHADEAGDRAAGDMATVLWPATWGYFIRQFLVGIAGLDPQVDLADWRRFVLTHVRGRGPLPALRVRDQPYGLLPVLPLQDWRPWPDMPELFVATLEGPRGAATARLRVGLDLDARGGWTGAFEELAPLPLDVDTDALDVAAADLDGDTRPELVLLTAGPSGATYRVGRRLDDPAPEWSEAQSVPTHADHTRLVAGATCVAAGPVEGAPAIVTVTQEESVLPLRPRRSTIVRVGIGLDVDAATTRWSLGTAIPGVGPGLRPAGAALGDLAGTGAADLVVAFADRAPGGDALTVRIGHGLTTGGRVERWSAPVPVPYLTGAPIVDAGVAVAELGGTTAVLVHAVFDLGGTQTSAYVVALGVDADGNAADGWQGPFHLGNQPEGAQAVRAAGIAVAPLRRDRAITAGLPTGLVNLLGRARRDWETAAAHVPRIGRTADPTDDILDLFATDAVSGTVHARGLTGEQLLANMWLAAGRAIDLDAYTADLRSAAVRLLEDWQLVPPGADPAATPRIARAVFEELARPLDVPLASEQSSDLIAFAATATPHALHDLDLDGDAPLLDRLVRHSTLQAWADAALELLPPAAPRDQAPWAEPELIDLADLRDRDPVAPAGTPTAWRHLDRAVFPAGDPQWPSRPVKDVVTHLLALAEQGDRLAAHGAAGRRIVELAELRAALTRLADAPPEALARLLGETLDISSHRLDAWLTAVAAERLAALRGRTPHGIALGGFGALIGLEPRTAPLSEGYVHAPSIGQAGTAAVLRSAHLAHAGDPLGRRLALDLDSRRVRLAMELSEGVANGQPLAALLGYRFERALLAAPTLGLGRYLPPLRQLFPMTAGKREAIPVGTSVAAVAAVTVVDGLALLRGFDGIPWGTTPAGADDPLPPADSDDAAAVAGAASELRDAVDALGDLGVAEAVHQAIHGNAAAAGGALDVLAGGEVPPVAPEVVRTPHGGIAVTHRLLLSLPDPAEPAAAAAVARWPGAGNPRASAQPRLDAWAALLLGDPAQVRWRARWSEAGEATFTLADVALSAIDALYADAADGAVEDPGARTDLERLLALHAAAHPPTDVAGELTIDLTPAADWPAGVLSAGELLAIAEAARALIADARPATADDLAGPAAVRAPAVPPAGLATAAAGATAALDTALELLRAEFAVDDPSVLAAAYPELPTERFDAVENLLDLPRRVALAPGAEALGVAAAAVGTALTSLAPFGIRGAMPAAADAVPETLAEQARTIASEAATRLAAADAAADPAAALQAVFGPGFVVVGEVAVPLPDDLRAGLDARAGDPDDLALADWLESVGRVREPTARLADVRLLSAAAGHEAVTLVAAQLPSDATGTWAGDVPPPGAALPGGLVDLVFAGSAPDTAGTFAGLVVDEFTEVLPTMTQDTGVVFHVDAPGATAPQAALLACAPDPARAWDDDALERVVVDALALARIRAVDLDTPQGPPVGQVLPGLLLVRNTGGDPHGDTVATAFTPGAP